MTELPPDQTSRRPAKRLRIVSDGTARGTVVYDADGEPVNWGSAFLQRIEIMPIEAGGVVRAVFTVVNPALAIDVADDAENASIDLVALFCGPNAFDGRGS